MIDSVQTTHFYPIDQLLILPQKVLQVIKNSPMLIHSN